MELDQQQSAAVRGGALAHQSVVASGEHQHYFYNATATVAVAAADTLFAYVYLDPANLPSEVMLQWNDGSWEHRAYWGADLIGWARTAGEPAVHGGVAGGGAVGTAGGTGGQVGWEVTPSTAWPIRSTADVPPGTCREMRYVAYAATVVGWKGS